MDCRYIALLDAGSSAENGSALLAYTRALTSLGMRRCPCAGPVTLFLSEETPALATPDGGFVIGNLFSRNGEPVLPHALSNMPHGNPISRHLLENFWGDYILLQPATEESGRIEVLRDPSGSVACVYSIKNGSGFITSDISLATFLGLYQKQIDWDFIAHALVYPYLKTQRTGLVNVRELLPGCSLHIRMADTSVAREWSPWDFVAGDKRCRDQREAAELTRKAVATVVAASANSDRSILVELSGGLDSSIVAACLQGAQVQVACCNLVTPVPGADERFYAAQIASRLGVELQATKLGFDEANFSFPTPSSAVAPRIGVLQHVVDEAMTATASTLETTSFYSGGGGDTVFGYLHGASPAADAFKERGLCAGIAAIRDLSAMHNCTLWKASRLAVKKLARPTKPFWKAQRSLVHPSVSGLRAEQHPWLDTPEFPFSGDVERIVSLVGTQAFRESAPRGLRLPLLSQPVVEAGLMVPTWMCILGGENRAIARSAFAHLLPADVLNRRSKGSFTSYYGATFQRSKEQIRAFLQTSQLMDRRLLDPKALAGLFDGSHPPRDTSFMRAFDLCMIENWVQNQN